MKKRTQKVFTSSLAVLLTITMLPLSAFASSVDIDLSQSECDYYNLIEKNDYALAPGAVESEIILNDSTGGNRNVVHVIEVDLTNDNISVMPTYKGLEEGIDLDDSANWGAQQLTEQAAHVENHLGLNVVGGINTNLRYNNDHPYGVLVWNGVVYSDERNASGVSTAQTFLSVTKEGVASLHSATESIPEDAWNAVSANFGWILKDGVNQYKTDDHADASRAPRTVIGIKEDGTLVLMMNDGRQSPYSAGTTMRELAEIMLSLGCVDAVNCDGGGSSTFISEREGTGELTMKSSPSDGGQRATLGGLLVISKAVADGKFDHATVVGEHDYVTPDSTVTFTATGADSAGGPADIPTDGSVTWQLEDSSYGAVENGVFTSNGKTGEVVVQMVYNGEVVGEDSVNVVIPEEVFFAQTNMTVPYGKTVTLDIRATVNHGLNRVEIKEEDFEIELSDDSLGTISGFDYTSCEENKEITSGTIQATLKYDETKVTTANISLGKGSEVVWNFEDGSTEGLTFGTGYGYKHKKHPELGRLEKGEMKVVDATTGKVKNGEKALALVCDYSDVAAMGYQRVDLKGLGVDLTDFTSVGFWVYLPTEAIGTEIDFNNSAIVLDTGDSNYYSQDGWYYISATKDDGVKGSLDTIEFYHTDEGLVDSTNIKSKFTIYIDDITVDYSTAVEDREAPEFSGVSTLVEADTYGKIENGHVFESNTVTLLAEVTENTSKSNYTGLDMSTTKVYVDGVELTSGYTYASNGCISLNDMELPTGVHKVRFEVCDNNNNMAYIERDIVVVDTDAEVTFVPADPTATDVLMGSVQYFYLNVKNADKIDSVTTVLDLDGLNDWELEHMVVAPGFGVEYTLDEDNNDLMLKVTRQDGYQVSGNTTLVSIPVRVHLYTSHEFLAKYGCTCTDFVSGGSVQPSAIWASDGMQHVAICISAEKGIVKYIDGTTDTFSAEDIQVETEMNFHRDERNTSPYKEARASKSSWHYHVEGETKDKTPTCTETGYTGRTFCIGCACGTETEHDASDGCGSVVDWGTTIPATGHTYEVVDGQLVCDCGEVLVTTGFVTIGEETYYAINGALKSGWQIDGGDYYFFEPDTFASVDGTVEIGGYTYLFKNHILIEGAKVIDENGIRIMWAGNYKLPGWFTMCGNTYAVDMNLYLHTGKTMVSYNNQTPIWCEFDEEGVLIKKMNPGLYISDDGATYYLDKNSAVCTGLILAEDGYYYYFSTSNSYKAVTGKRWVTHVNNTGFAEGMYEFDKNGRMIIEPEEPEAKNGIYEENGNLYYYVNGVKTSAGLIEIDGAYYYVRSNGLVATGKYWVTNVNTTGFEQGMYEFGTDGKMITESEEPEAKNGIYEENGNLYYYVNGVKTSAGLIEIDGAYYYVRSNGLVATGKYWVTNVNNTGFEQGMYEFGTDGKMVTEPEEPEAKNGIYEENGNLYYYVNGVKTSAGLIEIDGAYYYVRSNGLVATGKYWVTNVNNTGFEQGVYEFGTDGKMVTEPEEPEAKNGIYEENGNLYYYVNGVKTSAGLIEIDGAYYYVRSNGLVATGKYWVTNVNNTGFEQGIYEFGTDGKMIIVVE